MRKERTLTGKYFLANIRLLLVSVFILSLGISSVLNFYLQRETRLNTDVAVSNITFAVDSMCDDLNSFSLSFAQTETVRNILFESIPEHLDSGFSLSSDLTELYMHLGRLFSKGYKVGISSSEGYYIWIGNRYDVKRTAGEVDRVPFGKYEISVSEIAGEYFDDFIFSSEHGSYLTLSRTVHSHLISSSPYVTISVYMPIDDIVKVLTPYDDMNLLDFAVYDGSHRLIYGNRPYSGEHDGYVSEGTEFRVIDASDGHISIVFMIPVVSTLAVMMTTMLYALIIFVFLAVPLMLISYHQARIISEPIKQISEGLANLRIDGDTAFLSGLDTDVVEIRTLRDSISLMHKNLQKAMDDMVASQNFEIQARLLAMQAQMQPHFIYNCLMTISSLSDENKNNEVSVICTNLTRMLRYVSQSSPGGVSIASELEYLDSYISIMKIRFPETELFDNLPLDMLDINVPKLLVQPLVENAIKYSGTSATKICLDGSVDGNMWRITVINRGKPFSEEALAEMERKMALIRSDYRQLNQAIDGMGLVNIYSRLYMLYGEDAVFSVRSEGGYCYVTIGGRIS